MEKHQKIDRVILTICAYVFGALVARQLAPEKAHLTLAGEPDHAAVAQPDEDAAVVSPPVATGTDDAEQQPVLNPPLSDEPNHSVELIAPSNRKPTNSVVAAPAPAFARPAPVKRIVADDASTVPRLANRPEAAAKNELAITEPDAEIDVVESGDADTTSPALAIDELANDMPNEDSPIIDDKSVDRPATDDVAIEDDAGSEVDVVSDDSVVSENEDVTEEDVAAEPAGDDASATAPALADVEPQHGDNCPGAPLGAAEPAGVEPSGIFANDASRDAKSDAGVGDENDTDTLVPSAIPQATPEWTPQLIALERKISRALDIYRHRNLNTAQHSAWSIMHSLISFGVEKELFIGGPGGQRVNAIGWICFNGLCRGENLFYLDKGRIQGRLGPGRQGHNGQFLAMLAQSRVKIDYPMRIEGREFTIADLVRAEQETCRPKSELTFKLIGLSHYLDIDETWQSDDGQQWSIDRVVGEEIRQPIIGAACGGTHRLFGLAYAVDRRRRSGRPIDGNFKRAEIYLDDYHDYVFRLQNRDGSFSTNWFSGRGADMDLERRLETTGHTTEWLAFSLPDEELLRPQMIKAVDYLADLLIDGQNRDWKIGPQGHGLHALNIFHTRVFSSTAGRAVESLTDAK